MTETRKIRVRPVDETMFKGLGQIVRIPTQGEREPTTKDAGAFRFYGGVGIMDCHGTFELGICTFEHRPARTERLERHAGTPEMLFAIDGDFTMPVAPIKIVNGESMPDTDRIVGIRVKQGTGVIFDDGVWHWAPFPDKPSSSVIVGFRKGTATEDIAFSDLGFAVELVE